MQNSLGWWMVFLLLPMMGCYEEREGCLDVLSSNFDVAADIACSDCCNYPSINLAVEYPIPAVDSVLKDVNGHTFTVEKLSFYLANLHLTDDLGNEYALREKLTYQIEDAEGNLQQVVVGDNFILANATLPKNVRLGTFEAGGPFAGLHLELSLPDSLAQAGEGSFDFNHPLSASNGLLGSGSYYSGNFTLLQTSPDTIVHEYFLNLASGTSIHFPISFFPEKGSNIEIVLDFDFSVWLSGLDLSTLDSIQVVNQFSNQFIEGFSLNRIE